MDLDQWKLHMRIAIQGASIASQAHAKMNEGLGAPDEKDMVVFAEEAAALADLWEDSLPR